MWKKIPCWLFLYFFALSSEAVIIQPTNRVDWIVGQTVGSRVTITNSNFVPITGLDATGTNDCSTAINAAIQAASAGDVLFLSNGWYRCNQPIFLNKSEVTLRGQGTNTIIFSASSNYLLIMGNQGTDGGTHNIVAGYEKGSTNLTLDSVTGFTVGDLIRVSTDNPPTNEVTTIASLGFGRLITQTAVINSISGSSITISPPLIWNFNHTPTVQDIAPFAVSGSFLSPRYRIGLENLRVSQKDPTSTNIGTGTFMFQVTTCFDSWVTGCTFDYAANYNVSISDSAHITFRRNVVASATSGGSNHSGLLLANASGCLIEDNYISENLGPGIEFNSGFTGNAIFANYIGNVDCHNAHPMMNLFEQNRMWYFELDGYYGSVSHQTLFRNAIEGWQASLLLKRWSTYIQIVGNVLAVPGTPSHYTSNVNGDADQVVQIGYPNIGNNTYTGTNPPIAWNDPGDTHRSITNAGTTNVLYGDFSFVPAFSAGNNAGRLFNTNGDGTANFDSVYYSRLSWSGTGDGTQLTLLQSVAAGTYVFYLIGPSWYQQLQSTDRASDLFHGNWDYADNEIKWDSGIADHTIPSSLLYDAAPSWWGTNRWPCIGSDKSPMTTETPAESKFLGKGGGTNFYTMTLTTNGAGTIALSPSASSYADGTVVAVTATANSGNTFTGWSGDIGGSVNPTNITMSASKSVTGSFETNAIVRTRIVFH